MTGGIIPLAATLASESIFDAFVGESKVSCSNYSLNPSFEYFVLVLPDVLFLLLAVDGRFSSIVYFIFDKLSCFKSKWE